MVDDKIEVDLIEAKEALKRKRFWGKIIEVWQDGQIIGIEKDQTFKPKDFYKVGGTD